MREAAVLLEEDLADPMVMLVYNFCVRMTLSKEEAEQATAEVFQRAARGTQPESSKDRELWLLKIANHVMEQRLKPTPDVSFDLLDDTLRSEATRTQEVASLSQPEREVLLWELKQGCMTSVINCLTPAERAAFVLAAVLGRKDSEAAQVLGIKTSAYKVRLSRAKKKIGDYLAPRCEHVDASNPCRCPSRIGVALAKGFISPPRSFSGVLVQLRRPFDKEIRSRDATNIFRTLPEPELPASLKDLKANK
jgi:RNA polymerase sigma-70 factor (ECF subfamily)